MKKRTVKLKKRAVLQFLNNIQRILKKEAEWDKNYKEKNVKIYPILILHDNTYNCPGIDDLVRMWFEEELKRIKDNYGISQIENITTINIDVFIAYKELFQKRETSLDKMISAYHKYVSGDVTKKARTNKEIERKYIDRIIPFEYYLSKKYSPDYETLLRKALKVIIHE